MARLEKKKDITEDGVATVDNVREILKDSIKEQVQEAAAEVVSKAIDDKTAPKK